MSTPKRRGKDPADNLATTIESKFKKEKLAVKAKCVDVDGGHLAVIVTMALPSSMSDERRVAAVDVANEEYATFLRSYDPVKPQLDKVTTQH